jgi:hypothetical protein
MSLGSVRSGYLAAAVGGGFVAAVALVAMWAPWAASASTVRAANVAVDCEPSQRALVRQVATDGDPLVAVQCVSAAGAQPIAYVDASGRLLAAPASLGTAGVVPAVYHPPAPVERVVTRAASPARTVAPRRTATPTATTAPKKRTWQTRAMVIGGSAGAGAGLGAIIGGKKGAAIGAAIGGGAGAVYEATRK